MAINGCIIRIDSGEREPLDALVSAYQTWDELPSEVIDATVYAGSSLSAESMKEILREWRYCWRMERMGTHGHAGWVRIFADELEEMERHDLLPDFGDNLRVRFELVH